MALLLALLVAVTLAGSPAFGHDGLRGAGPDEGEEGRQESGSGTPTGATRIVDAASANEANIAYAKMVDKGPPPVVTTDLTASDREYVAAIQKDRNVTSQLAEYRRLDRVAQENGWPFNNPRVHPTMIVLDFTGSKGVSYAHITDIKLRTTVTENGRQVEKTVDAGEFRYVDFKESVLEKVKVGDPYGFETVHHELGHLMMYATHHGYRDWPKRQGKYESHWRSMKSDPHFAFTEGWAEFLGSYYAKTPAGDYSIKNLTPLGKDDLLSTEGWVAQTLLAIAKDRTINKGDPGRGFRMVMEANLRNVPQTGGELFVAIAKDNPEYAERVRAIVRDESNDAIDIERDQLIEAKTGLSWRRVGQWFDKMGRSVGGFLDGVRNSVTTAAKRGWNFVAGLFGGGKKKAAAPESVAVSGGSDASGESNPGAERGSPAPMADDDRAAIYRRYLDAVAAGDTREIEINASRLRRNR